MDAAAETPPHLSPLRERVTAPAVLEPPVSDGMSWRAATVADLDAILDCETEIGEADHPTWVTPREDLEEEFEHSYVDVQRDTIVAVDGDGVVLAYGFVVLSPGQESLVRSILMGGVRPSARGRGLGRLLLAWQEGRALQQLATSEKPLPGWIMAHAEARAVASERLLTRAGFAVSRYYLEVTRDLAQPIADREVGDGLRIVTFDRSRDDATRLARNDAFRDHWGSQPTNEEQWASYTGSPLFRNDLSAVAVTADDEVAGFVMTSVNEDDWAKQGFTSAYIGLLGVRREWRGRGIAPALLSHAMRAFAAAGLERAVLDVDAENPSGALGLYTGVGFVEASRSMSLLKTF